MMHMRRYLLTDSRDGGDKTFFFSITTEVTGTKSGLSHFGKTTAVRSCFSTVTHPDKQITQTHAHA